MIFHTFGSGKQGTVLFLHGLLTPWQIFTETIDLFSDDYEVIAAELDGHTQKSLSTFHSVKEEADEILDYLRKQGKEHLRLLAGLSMGGRIAAELAKRKELRIDALLLDGAPLLKFPGPAILMMEKNYLNLLKKSRRRDPAVLKQCTKDFLPEAHLSEYLAIADRVDEASVKNILREVFSSFVFEPYDPQMRILFVHGTGGNEYFSKRGAERMKACNPGMEIRCLAGLKHAEHACFHPLEWGELARAFLEQSK